MFYFYMSSYFLKILGLDQVSILSYGGLFQGCSVTGDLIIVKV